MILLETAVNARAVAVFANATATLGASVDVAHPTVWRNLGST